MANANRKILVIMEGAKRDKALMWHMLQTVDIAMGHQIVSYEANIYELFRNTNLKDLADYDLLAHLKSRESDATKHSIFETRYSDVILVFDFDPQDQHFRPETLRAPMQHFSESTDMGKLYVNYPMLEAFYHMRSIPDEAFHSYVVPISELSTYKHRVSEECRNKDYKRFAANLAECRTVIQQT